MTFEEKIESKSPMTLLEFAHLGDGEVAYIRQLDLAAAQKLFPAFRALPEFRGIPLDIDLYAVLGADGSPIALTDSRDSAIANALENDLTPLSVH
jgi:hypothetical protein